MNRLIVHGFVRATLLYAFSGFSILADDVVPSNEAIKAAVVKSLPLLETAARGSMEKRKQCFTCHNQALPVMALTMARSRGITIDPENLRRQVEFTAEFLARNRTNYLAGRGQGGQALTAGYALWTLEMGGWKSDATTDAVSEYLLKFQNDLQHWKPQTIRPPSEESLFTVSYVALRGLKTFGTAGQQERISQRTAQVRQCLSPGAAFPSRETVARRLVACADTERADPDILRVGLSPRRRSVHLDYGCRLGDDRARARAAHERTTRCAMKESVLVSFFSSTRGTSPAKNILNTPFGSNI